MSFVEIPPFEMITDFFNKLTGVCWNNEAMWNGWKELDEFEIAQFESFIRPCHRKLIYDLLKGRTTDPTAFLRQLLRPYGWTIVVSNQMVEGKFYKRYFLREKKDPLVIPARIKPTAVDWIV